ASHARIRAAHPEVESTSVRVRGLERELLGDARRPLVLLLGAAGFLLLVACANVTSTLLARGMARRGELAVRASLGAGRGRLVRQLLAESVVLSALGALVAVPLAWGVLVLTSSLDPGAVPRLGEVALDGRTLLFTGGATLATAALFGLLPAVQLTRDLGGRLRAGRVAGADRRARATWRVLMAGEVALALVLVAGAGLTLRSLSEILTRDLGYSPRGVVAGELHLPPEKYASAAEAVEWIDGLLETLDVAPGVGAAGLNVLLPVRGRGALGSPVILEDGERSEAVFQYRVADGGWFRALDVPLVRGRVFDDEDADGPHVAVVDEVMARSLWPGEDPLGKRFNAGGMDPYRDEWLTVVGVVGEVRTWSQDPGTNPTFYVSHRQRPAFLGLLGTAVVARTDDPARGVAVLRETVRTMDPDVPVRAATLRSLLADSAADRRFTGFVLGAFAAVSLLLAAVGVYGVVSYTVARRTREMGIRLAVGASPARLRGRVQGEALSVVAVGLVVGLLASSALGAALESVLFEVSPLDPWTRFGAAAVLLATAAVASWLPARRSTRVDPVTVLRGE
ncbi:MAG: FtsX-like permease family protein, partial [Gemmatimonadota bacterium]